jgi:hypothetical protein
MGNSTGGDFGVPREVPSVTVPSTPSVQGCAGDQFIDRLLAGPDDARLSPSELVLAQRTGPLGKAPSGSRFLHHQPGRDEGDPLQKDVMMRRSNVRVEIADGLQNGHVVPLLARHSVFLFAPEYDGERFVRLFRYAWSRLPLWVRRRILAHWRDGDHGTIFRQLLKSSPQIELVGSWPGRNNALACVKANGHHLRFWSQIVHRFPDELVEDLIAHELAHVLQGAIGRLTYDADVNDDEELEEDANLKMESWGFDAYAMDDWFAEHCETPAVKDTATGVFACRRTISDRPTGPHGDVQLPAH